MSPRAPHRFYFHGRLTQTGDGEILLSPEESRHLLRVLRLRPGAALDLFDAAGVAFQAELVGEREGQAAVRLLAPIAREAETEPGPAVSLAVSILKRNPMDWMIEKLSELGVDTLQPLLAARSIGQGDIKPYSEPPERWERLAIAAAKQCGRNRPLTIHPPAPLPDWLRRPRPPALNLFAHTSGADTLSLGQRLVQNPDAGAAVWVAIGPEGGWTPAEAEAFAQAGFQPVSLGKLILRAETAALAAAATCRLAMP